MLLFRILLLHSLLLPVCAAVNGLLCLPGLQVLQQRTVTAAAGQLTAARALVGRLLLKRACLRLPEALLAIMTLGQWWRRLLLLLPWWSQ